MPVIAQKNYSHPLQYHTGDLELRARQKDERRTMPAAYTPKTATIHIQHTTADLDFEYSVTETPSGGSVIKAGVTLFFGKSTRKVVGASFEYPTLDELLNQLSLAAMSLRTQQNLVPQDSIKRNYQIAAEGLIALRNYIESDIVMLKATLDKEIPQSSQSSQP